MISDLGNGLAKVQAGPFPELRLAPFGNDYRGPLVVRETPTKFVIGAGPGGAPRVQYRARFAAGYPVVSDGFAADPGLRTGVTFSADLDESVVFGGGFPAVLWIDDPYPGGWVGDVAWAAYDLLRDCNVRVRTTRPLGFPSGYGVVAVGRSVSVADVGGTAPVGDWGLPDGGARFRPNAVYVLSTSDAKITAQRVAHESLHGLGEQHDSDPHSLMYGGELRPDARVLPETAARVRKRTGEFK